MRLSNPVQSQLFDRVPRVSKDARGTGGISSQSSGKLCCIPFIFLFKVFSGAKFKSFKFCKLGEFLCGDLLRLRMTDRVSVEVKRKLFIWGIPTK